jgi:hypothetical protein
MNLPVLDMPDFTRRFRLKTDASSCAIGAVLLQDFEDGRRPIAFGSRTLTDQESKFSTCELEAFRDRKVSNVS